MFGARSIQACLLVVAFQFFSATPLHAQGDRGTLTGGREFCQQKVFS